MVSVAGEVGKPRAGQFEVVVQTIDQLFSIAAVRQAFISGRLGVNP
ncbi:MAG: hypothetical protein J4F97_07125 [Pseudomonadales bacterium]|nr:hypothetical protein [Pseudomonadales bacterium]